MLDLHNIVVMSSAVADNEALCILSYSVDKLADTARQITVVGVRVKVRI